MSPTGQEALRRSVPSLARLPRPVHGRVEALARGSWTRPHRHRWAQLSYAIEGVLHVRAQAGSFLAPPHRAIWVPPGVEHAVLTSERAQMRSLYIDAARAPWPEPRCRVLEVSPLARELIRAAAELPARYDERGADGRLAEVLLDQIAAMREVALSLPLPVDPRLSEMSRALLASPDDRRSMGAWARLVGMSERTLARLLRRETGLSFREWRTRLRLLLSIERLGGGASVTAVALDSGYDSVSAFIAAFRRCFGKTPGDFLR